MKSSSWHWLALGILIAIETAAAPAVKAQIAPDGTLPRSSAVTRRGTSSVITGGTERGTNLFHSFRRFSVPAGGAASFQQVSPETTNIITRITGSSVSRIDGRIEVLQPDGSVSPANFFLINPNGIIFGRNASLNVGGSFMATTGDRLNFADGVQFRADGTQSSLLTISVPAGIQFGQSPGAILNTSVANLVQDENTGIPLAGGLQVPANRTLALVGGAVNISAGVAIAPSGRIELGSVGAGSLVNIASADSGWVLGYERVQSFQDLRLSNSALLDVSGAQAGSMQLQGRQVDLTNNATLTSFTNGTLNAGSIRIRADRLSLTGLSFITTLTEGLGRGGGIAIRAAQVTLQDGSKIATLTAGSGNGGDLVLAASDFIDLTGGVSAADRRLGTGLYAQAGSTSSATGGDLRITTRSLRLQNGAQISTTTFGAGDAGNMTISAETIRLSGALLQPNGTVLVDRNRTYPTGLFTDTDTDAAGNGGNLVIVGDRLTLRDGAILQTNTEGSGRAGNLTIRAADFVEVSGTAAGLTPSTLFAASGGLPELSGGGEITATGQGGTLSITTPELRVQNGAVVAVTSLNPDLPAGTGAGQLRVDADRILLDNRGRLLSDSASGNGGNLRLQAQTLVFLGGNSQISATAGVDNQPGNGGNLRIDSNLIVAASGNSDILANAFTGRGGTVTINAPGGVIGIQPRQLLTTGNDITAFSERGVNGTIRINSVEVDPSRGVVALPADAIDAANQIAQACSGGSAANPQGSFIVTGRGGLPQSPTTPRSGTTAIDWATPERGDRVSTLGFASVNPVNLTPVNLSSALEAQGWVMRTDGTVSLVAQALATSAAFSEQRCADLASGLATRAADRP